MDVLGLRVPWPTRGPPAHAPNLEHSQRTKNLGAGVAHGISWAQVLLLQHPSLPCGTRVVLPHQHHRGSVQKGAALIQATGKPTTASQWEILIPC